MTRVTPALVAGLTWLLVMTPGAMSTPVKAREADSFIESIGVAAHINYIAGSDEFYNIVKPALGELGVRYVRDGGSSKEFKESVREVYRDYGIKFTLVIDPRDGYSGLSVPQDIILPLLGAVVAVEGPNEWDVNERLTYKGSNFPDGVRRFQNEMYKAVKNFNHPNLSVRDKVRRVQVLTPSIANANNGHRLGQVSADGGNMHSYTGGMLPDQDLDKKWLPLTKEMLDNRSKPLVATETGWCNDLSSPDACTGQGGVSEKATAKYIPRMYLEYFRRGIQRCHVYNFSTDEWSSFLRRDGSKRPAFYAVKSMIALLKDPGPRFSPRSLDFKIRGNTSDLRSLLLQKRNGTFYLVLWLNTLSFKKSGGGGGEDIDSQRNVEVAFGSKVSSVRVFQPSFNGTSTVKTLSASRAVRVTVPDHPLILEISTGKGSPPPSRPR